MKSLLAVIHRAGLRRFHVFSLGVEAGLRSISEVDVRGEEVSRLGLSSGRRGSWDCLMRLFIAVCVGCCVALLGFLGIQVEKCDEGGGFPGQRRAITSKQKQVSKKCHTEEAVSKIL